MLFMCIYMFVYVNIVCFVKFDGEEELKVIMYDLYNINLCKVNLLF